MGARQFAAGSWRLSPPVSWSLAILSAFSGIAYLYATEGARDGFFAAAVLLLAGALLVLASRRLLPAVIIVCAAAATIRVASHAKQQATEVVLHAYEVVQLFGSSTALGQFWSAHRDHALALLAVIVATALLTAVAHRLDATRIARRYAAGACGVLLLAVILATVAKGERRHTEFYFEDTYVSFFLASWSEALGAVWRGGLLDTGHSSATPGIDHAAACTPAGKPPHIILIHQESVAPPSYFPSLSYDRGLDQLFQSHDGQLRKLRVETYGGASWLTEFSVLTGLSTYSFGSMRQFVQQIMAGKVRETLPRALAHCGYRNIMFYPMLRRFAGSERFFEGAGIGEIFDAKAQKAQHANERDRFYYSNLLTELERHLKSSRQPVFAYLETMAAHGGYSYAYMPEVEVPGGGPGTPPEMHEYLRRLGMARMDYAFLRSELARRFPGEQFLIVHYGDHQSTATWKLHGFAEDASMDKILESRNTAAFLTYYAVDSVRYRPPALPTLDVLDVPYLGTIVLEAARLPLSPMQRERRRLMLLCGGRYGDCPAQEEIMTFHRRLIESSLVDRR